MSSAADWVLRPRARWRAWWAERTAPVDSTTLTQRNIYIVPTRAGLMFALTVLVLLLASLNYQLSLGFALTFLLAGSAVASMHMTHDSLRGLTMHLKPVAPVFAGESAALEIVVTNPGRARFGVGVGLDTGVRPVPLAYDEIGARGQTVLRLSWPVATRGWHGLPTVRAESRFPFGLFKAWTLWRPAGRVCVWPAPERPAPPWPETAAQPGPEQSARATGGAEFDGVRAYRRGDTMRQVVWKKAARTGELVSRDSQQGRQRALWIDWSQAVLPDPEQRLARLCAWVLQADRAGERYGLRLPQVELPPDQGPQQRLDALRALAEGMSGARGPAVTTTVRAGAPRRDWAMPPSRESRDTLFMVALIGWTIAPHLDHLPTGVAILAFAVLAWRALLAWRQAPLPGRGTVLALLGAAAALTWWSDRTLLGKEAGVTLLVMLMALKTLELRARRDALVVFFLGFFLVLTHFLYSQSLATAVAMALSVWGWLTALTLAHMPSGRPPVAQAARLAGRAALVGTPVMLLLFLLFPRIGPLWALPGDSARTGLSDRLELGNVAELANDDSIAFRIRFDGTRPDNATLYFRGPVLVDTDGRTWQTASPSPPSPEVLQAAMEAAGDTADRARGPSLHYQVTYEPSTATWLPVLEQTLLPGESSTGTLQVVSGGEDVTPRPDVSGQWRVRALTHRVQVRATAWPDHLLEARAVPVDLRRDLRLPGDAHPRMKAWARAERARAGADDGPDALAMRLLTHIRTQPFAYTLTPGLYEGDTVDEFWFDRRAGFCEHFATAFTVAMRAMGVPARVVTGYQGVDPTPQDGEWIVRQSYAHAWSEYWVAGRGWVRVDPTAAVAPDRIERGRALPPRQGFVGSALSAVSPGLQQQLRQWWETLDNRWNQWVLNYDKRSQFDLLKHLGFEFPDTEDLGRVMVGVVTLAALAGAGTAWLDARRRTPGQRHHRRLAASLKPLMARGLEVPPHASAGTLAAQLRRRFGAASQRLATRLEDLERARYGPASGEAAEIPRETWRALATEARALADSLPGTRPGDR